MQVIQNQGVRMAKGRPKVVDRARRWKSYSLYSDLIKDLKAEGLQDQTIIRTCIIVYRRLSEKNMFGNRYSSERAWDTMSIALLDELNCDVNLIEATMKEMTDKSR